MTRPRTLPLGSVSTGTMRHEDLIPAFLSVAEDLRLSREHRRDVTRLRHRFDELDHDSLDLGEDLDELFSILENYCPDYCYFGSHPSDAACYGCWPCEDLMQDHSEVHGSADPPDIKADGYTGQPYWLTINDHGNMTLHRRAGNRWVECWSVV